MTIDRKFAAGLAIAAALTAAVAIVAVNRSEPPPGDEPSPLAPAPAKPAENRSAPGDFWAALPDPLVTVNQEAIARAEVQAALPADTSPGQLEDEPRLRAAVQAAARLVDARLALGQIAEADRGALQTRVELERASELRRYGNDQAWSQELARRLQTPQAWLTLVQTRAALDMALEAAQGAENPTEAELRQRYDRRKARWELPGQMHWREIAVQVEAGEAEAGERARKTLELAQQRLAKGEDFAAVADELARSRTRQPGGDRGWNRMDELDPAIARALEALEPGQRSGLVISGHAMHIVEVLEKRPPGLRPFDEVRDQLQAELLGERRFVQRRRLLESLRDKARIRWGNEHLSELAATVVRPDKGIRGDAVPPVPTPPPSMNPPANPPPGTR